MDNKSKFTLKELAKGMAAVFAEVIKSLNARYWIIRFITSFIWEFLPVRLILSKHTFTGFLKGNHPLHPEKRLFLYTFFYIIVFK